MDTNSPPEAFALEVARALLTRGAIERTQWEAFVVPGEAGGFQEGEGYSAVIDGVGVRATLSYWRWGNSGDTKWRALQFEVYDGDILVGHRRESEHLTEAPTGGIGEVVRAIAAAYERQVGPARDRVRQSLGLVGRSQGISLE